MNFKATVLAVGFLTLASGCHQGKLSPVGKSSSASVQSASIVSAAIVDCDYSLDVGGTSWTLNSTKFHKPTSLAVPFSVDNVPANLGGSVPIADSATFCDQETAIIDPQGKIQIHVTIKQVKPEVSTTCNLLTDADIFSTQEAHFQLGGQTEFQYRHYENAAGPSVLSKRIVTIVDAKQVSFANDPSTQALCPALPPIVIGLPPVVSP